MSVLVPRSIYVCGSRESIPPPFFILITQYSYSDYLAYDERPHLHVGYPTPEPVSAPVSIYILTSTRYQRRASNDGSTEGNKEINNSMTDTKLAPEILLPPCTTPHPRNTLPFPSPTNGIHPLLRPLLPESAGAYYSSIKGSLVCNEFLKR